MNCGLKENLIEDNIESTTADFEIHHHGSLGGSSSLLTNVVSFYTLFLSLYIFSFLLIPWGQSY